MAPSPSASLPHHFFLVFFSSLSLPAGFIFSPLMFVFLIPLILPSPPHPHSFLTFLSLLYLLLSNPLQHPPSLSYHSTSSPSTCGRSSHFSPASIRPSPRRPGFVKPPCSHHFFMASCPGRRRAPLSAEEGMNFHMHYSASAAPRGSSQLLMPYGNFLHARTHTHRQTDCKRQLKEPVWVPQSHLLPTLPDTPPR